MDLELKEIFGRSRSAEFKDKEKVRAKETNGKQCVDEGVRKERMFD